MDSNLALKAAQLGVQHKIPMADSMILATAYQYKAEVWTQDNDFEGLPNVRYIVKG